ncbi:amino acid-binding protein [Desulfobacula sp.]|uniref:amino acid-binding protein n=1 Tax=Desulfobacula sp. TaxID=2593537 RepID=UPI00260CAE86|nr:amino acid-binding protein [Desulfobacula sp.]
MIRIEISLFLKNVPGELAKLTELLGSADINIDAITIQDASAYVQNLFEARGKSLKRHASSASYSSMRRDSAEFALIRLVTNQPEKSMALLNENDYLFDSKEVVTIEITNTPGELTKITKKFGEEQININYVYGSVSDSDGKCLFVFCPEDVKSAAAIFQNGYEA